MTVWSTISPSDLKRIQELRELVKDDLSKYYDTDFNLLRWLQGHSNLSIQKIAAKLIHHLKLRKSTWDLDNMKSKPRCHPIHNYWKYGITGLSGVLENVIVNIEQCGRTDYTGMMESFSISEVMKARILDLEEMLRMCMDLEEKTGKQAYILYIMDISGLEYNKKLYDLITGSMRSLAEFMADHYVEMIKFFVPVCIPSFAYALWLVVRPLLPERTKNKVRILSSSNWRDDILEFASRDVLPAIWNDETHSFPVHIDLPIPYPKEMFYSHNNVEIPEGIKVVDVTAGKSYVITKHLYKGDVISWWISGNKAYGFGFLETKNEDDDDYEIMNQVVPTFPWMPGPTITPLEDRIAITQDGIYKIWISNMRSWWSTLTVQLAIKIEERAIERE